MMLKLLVVAVAGAAAEYCVQGYTDDACKTKATDALVCTPLTCRAVTGGSQSSVCDGNSYKTTVFTSTDCTGTGTTTSTDLNKCKADTMSGKAGVTHTTATCGSCFALDDTAELESGKRVALSDLKIGDRVLAVAPDGSLTYSPVFRFGHRAAERKAFNRITLASGDYLDITNSHYVFANACCSLDAASMSHDVKPGDKMWVRDAGALKQVAVTDVSTVFKQGAINPHTVVGTIVVNNVVATHFTAEATWGIKSLAPWWYAAVHAYNTAFGVTA